MAPKPGVAGYGLIGSANRPPRPDKLYPQITFQELLYAVGVVTTRREPQSGRISALAPFRRLRACTPDLTAALLTAMKKNSYNTHY